MNHIITLFFVILFLLGHKAIGQNLKCEVNIITNQIEGSDKQIFNTLQKSLTEFMNNKNWANHSFKDHEKIECNINITITARAGTDAFKGNIQVQSIRPVFNANMTTPIFNSIDEDFSFQYVEFEPIEFNEQIFTSNLSSVLAFYAYIILGFDYDSYSQGGGTPFFEKANQITLLAQDAGTKGWAAIEDDGNRYWLIENVLNVQYKALRSALYSYHRLGLDLMTEKREEAIKIIEETILSLNTIYEYKAGTFLLKQFFVAKSDEIVNIFSDLSAERKQKLYSTLVKIDPGNVIKYKKIIKN